MLPALERRQCKRYAMDLAVHFKVRKENRFVDGGDGRIHDVSRAGMFFQSSAFIPPGSVVRAIVEWPVRFQGKTRIDWIVEGIVVRSGPSGTALDIRRQHFERAATSRRKKMAS
jgi:hypothetical protein